MGGWFSNIVALAALVISLASAGWSAFAYVTSSEVRPLPMEEVVLFSEEGVPQVRIEMTLSNLAYGDYHDVARHQILLLDTGERTLRFVARRTASLGLLRAREDGTYAPPDYPCYAGGLGLMVCPVSETPVVSLPAGEVVTLTPVFELADRECGLDNCVNVSLAELGAAIEGPVIVTYSVETMRDGVRSVSCELTVTAEQVQYFTQVAGWFNPRCESAEAEAL